MLGIIKINVVAVVISFIVINNQTSRQFSKNTHYSPKFMCYLILIETVLNIGSQFSPQTPLNPLDSIVWYHIDDLLQKILIMCNMFLNKMWLLIFLWSS